MMLSQQRQGVRRLTLSGHYKQSLSCLENVGKLRVRSNFLHVLHMPDSLWPRTQYDNITDFLSVCLVQPPLTVRL